MKFFDTDFLDFFKDLAANNHREWFHENKPRYEASVKVPFEKFVTHVLDHLRAEDPRYGGIEAKHCIFRINRDVRFSADKSPYKLHMAAQFSIAGKGNPAHPGFYIQIGPEEMFFAGGCYTPDKDQLFRIREFIIQNWHRVEEELSNPEFRGFFGGLAEGEKNKILPKDFKEYGTTMPILFNKQYYFAKTYIDPNVIFQDSFISEVLKAERIGRGWNNLITEALS